MWDSTPTWRTAQLLNLPKCTAGQQALGPLFATGKDTQRHLKGVADGITGLTSSLRVTSRNYPLVVKDYFSPFPPYYLTWFSN